jgi:hypothetical protein
MNARYLVWMPSKENFVVFSNAKGVVNVIEVPPLPNSWQGIDHPGNHQNGAQGELPPRIVCHSPKTALAKVEDQEEL